MISQCVLFDVQTHTDCATAKFNNNSTDYDNTIVYKVNVQRLLICLTSISSIVTVVEIKIKHKQPFHSVLSANVVYVHNCNELSSVKFPQMYGRTNKKFDYT